jgi:hypothetical protein
VAPRLERCVADDTAYLDCHTASPRSPSFLWNARVDLERGAAALAQLRAMRADRRAIVETVPAPHPDAGRR